MQRTLQTRLILSFLAIVLLVTGSLVVVTLTVVRTHYMDSLVDGLRTFAAAVDAQIDPLLAQRRFDLVQQRIVALDRAAARRITVIAADGTVLADSEHDPATMDNHRGRPEISDALSGGTGRAVRYSTTLREEMLYVATHQQVAGSGTPYVIRVSMFLRDFNALIYQLKRQVLRATVIIVFIALGAGALVARTLSRPLKDMQTAVEIIARGDFSARVHPPRATTEMTALADTFNTMASKVNALFAEVAGRTEQVNAILAAIADPLFVIGADGRIILSNDRFTTLTGTPALSHRYYWEVFRAPALESILKRAMATDGHAVDTLEHAGRSYRCAVARLKARDEYVVLLHDMTEEKKLGTIKRDLVANVSHELRTPLTAIKGFIETLDDMVTGEGKRYLDIIGRHTDRLISIVEDLLLLSEIENPLFKLDLRTCDASTIARDVMAMFQPRALAKGLRLILEPDADNILLKADPAKFEQMLINLIDNAIKYTDAGEIRVTLTSGPDMTVTVEDTGPGIPVEFRDRVFERFFVVDKSRARSVGGTGLGLSIVKHIVTLHGWSIAISGDPGKGARFIITIPSR